MENDIDEESMDKAFIDGWNSERILDNPYEDIILARFYVDGWVTKVKLQRLGLI